MNLTSLTSLKYDTCAYKTDLRSSVGPGDYMLATPTIECQNCFPFDPRFTPKGTGVALCSNRALVDVDSELMGLTRKASTCPSQKYVPNGDYCQVAPLPDCRSIPLEDTRVSNPPCTMRGGVGWNRWEWLCQNPQDKALVPFDTNINYRLVVKDNHRPCLPTPVSQVPALPALNGDDRVHSMGQPCSAQSAEIPSIHWRKACEYAAYRV